MPRIDLWLRWSQGCPNRLIPPRATGHPKEYTITHFAGGAMLNYFTSTFSSSCSVPIWTSIFGTKKQQNQNNQFISNQLSQTNIVLSKINFKCELLCSYCLHIACATHCASTVRRISVISVISMLQLLLKIAITQVKK